MTRRSNASNKTTRVETQRHKEATRTNIPTAELEGLVGEDESRPTVTDYAYRNDPDADPELYRRNPDLDPQLVWRGKDEQDRRGLQVDTVPIYIQEKIHPKAIIEDLRRRSAAKREAETDEPDMFADFNGFEGDAEAKLDFYQHQQNWTNRMILGDALQVMTSLAEKEALKGQVQTIYFDPPYGINFASNWQSTVDEKTNPAAGKTELSREPEVVKAFRDTWSDGINTYLSYLRERLFVCRELLTNSGSLFMQMG